MIDHCHQAAAVAVDRQGTQAVDFEPQFAELAGWGFAEMQNIARMQAFEDLSRGLVQQRHPSAGR